MSQLVNLFLFSLSQMRGWHVLYTRSIQLLYGSTHGHYTIVNTTTNGEAATTPHVRTLFTTTFSVMLNVCK